MSSGRKNCDKNGEECPKRKKVALESKETDGCILLNTI